MIVEFTIVKPDKNVSFAFRIFLPGETAQLTFTYNLQRILIRKASLKQTKRKLKYKTQT